MTLKNNIKSLIIQNGFSMSYIVQKLNEQNNTKYSLQNFSQKLSRNNLRYSEVEQILNIIGYSIKWEKIT